MSGIEHVPDPNAGYSDNYFAPIAVIDHIMQGYQQTLVNDGGRDGISAHFSIGRGGRKVQHVSVRRAAYHAGVVISPVWRLLQVGGNPNRIAVGVEHEGFSEAPRTYPHDYLYDAAHPWPDEMVRASIDVHSWVFHAINVIPTPDTLIPHAYTDTVTRANDPGSAWPRDAIMTVMKGDADVQTEALDQSKTIAVIQSIVANVSALVADSGGTTALKVTSGVVVPQDHVAVVLVLPRASLPDL